MFCQSLLVPPCDPIVDQVEACRACNGQRLSTGAVRG
jgi:hypothetical protein